MLSRVEMNDIRVRLNNRTLSDSDIKVVGSILLTYLWLHEQLDTAKLTMRRLKNMLGFKTEKKPVSKESIPPSASDATNPDDSETGDTGKTNSKKK